MSDAEKTEHLVELLSHWYECWSDCIEPDADMVEDTLAVLDEVDR